MEFKDRLKAARHHAKLNQTELAEAAGMTQTSISDLERGKSQSTSFVVQIAQACGVNPQWLAEGKGSMLDLFGIGNVAPMLQPHRKAKEYPLISWVAAGSWAEACDNFHPGDAEEWIESDERAGPHGYWLKVDGESMIPPTGFAFTEGIRILVQPEGFDLISGKLYIAKLLNTGETTFKQYVRDAGVEYLRPLNPSFKTLEFNDNVRIIGRVIDARPPKSMF